MRQAPAAPQRPQQQQRSRMENLTMADDLTRVTGLWMKSGRKAKFLSGQAAIDVPAGARLLAFRNDRRTEGSNDCDYVLYFAPAADASPSKCPTVGHGSKPPTLDDGADIPF